jgi:Protein of unknown function (DUF3800)
MISDCVIVIPEREIVRRAYVDEAGMSANEPFMVVAGVIVDPDKQWRAIHDELDDIRSMLPENIRQDFVFHAKELYNGGKNLPRHEWPLERKLPMINRLLEIPRKFSLPICLGYVEKSKFPLTPLERTPSAQELLVGAYAVCFAQASIRVEMWMRQNAPDEVADIVAEDLDLVRAAVKEAQTEYRHKDAKKRLGVDERYFPFTTIIDAPTFQIKTEASLLQVADMCAYTIRRFLGDLPHSRENFRPLKDNLIHWLAEE